MPKQEGQKSKLLALLRIFETQTDENHLLNVPQLVGLLEQQGQFHDYCYSGYFVFIPRNSP